MRARGISGEKEWRVGRGGKERCVTWKSGGRSLCSHLIMEYMCDCGGWECVEVVVAIWLLR